MSLGEKGGEKFKELEAEHLDLKVLREEQYTALIRKEVFSDRTAKNNKHAKANRGFM